MILTKPLNRFAVVAALFAFGCTDGDPTAETNDEVVVLPDLTITAVVAPPSARPWDIFDVDLTVCNVGTDYANPTDAVLSVSVAPIPQVTDPQIAFMWIPPLAPTQCHTERMAVSAPGVVDGAYYITAGVDPFNQVVESDEANNSGASPVIGIGYRPDLIVTSIDAPPSATNNFDATVMLCNQGTEPAFFSDVTMVFSTDQTIETITTNPMTTDWMAGYGSTSYVYPGSCEAVLVNVIVPPGTGAFYLGAVVDDVDNVLELVESNNVFVDELMGIGFGPDLVITAINAPTAANGSFDATVRLCNQGTDWASGGDIQLYASADTTIETNFTNPMTPDIYLGSVYPGTVYAGTCQDVPGTFFAPASVDALFLGAVADDANAVAELIESNNTFVGDRIGLGFGPDVYVRTIETPNAANGNFDLRVEVCNQGNDFLSSTDVTVYASTDATINGGASPSADWPIAWLYVSSLAPGECRFESANANAFFTGPHYIGAIADESSSVLELNEFNNTTVGNLMGFGYGIDVVVVSIDVPPSAETNFDLSVGICNFGTAYASSIPIGLYLTADTNVNGAPGGSDFLISYIGPTMGLDAGACEVVPVSASTAGLTGVQYVAAIVDPDRVFAELLETNNTFIGPQIGLGFGPDLVVESIDAPASADGPFDVDVRVCNQGTAYASSFNIDLVLTEDEVIDPLNGVAPMVDFPIGNAFASGLEVGECDVITIPSAAFAMPNPHYVAAVLDQFDNVLELREDNNDFIGARIGLGQGPDVVATDVSVTFANTGSANLTVTACNRGTTMSSSTDVHVMASADTVFSTSQNPSSSDFLLGAVYLSPMWPGECRTETAPGGWAPQGAYYLGGIVDFFDSTTELREDNNVFVRPDRVSFGPGVDLVVTALTSAPNTDGLVDFEVTVCNRGDSYGPSTDVTLRHAALPNLGTSQLLQSWPVQPLVAGACETVTINTPFFQTGYPVAIVDENDWQLEPNEENNRLVGERIVVGSGTDFVVTALDAPPNVDGPFAINWTVCNQGTTPGSTTVSLVASSNDTLTDFDPVLDIVNVTANAGQCVSGIANGVAILQGAVYLGGIVQHDPSELRNENDRFLGGIIGMGSGPDLVVEAVTTPPTAYGMFDVGYTVCNQGTATSGSTDLEVRLLGTPNFEGFFAQNGPPANIWAPVPTLAAGACHSGSVSTSEVDGIYYVAAVVDRYDGISELREENNTRGGDLLAIGSGPDLVVSAIASVPFGMPSGQFDVTTTICNQGTASFPGGDANIYLSMDDTITSSLFNPGGDFLTAPVVVPPLAAGQCDTVTVPAWAPGLEGVFYLGVIVDEYDIVPELLEQNNTTVGPTITFATVFCGNGIVDSMGEQCDDGNFVDGDGCSAQCFVEQHVWADNATGTVRNGPYRWNYAMGYHFTPNVDGTVSAIGGYFHGTKTVRLYERDTGALLAETTVTGLAPNGGFAHADIAPVAVTAGTRYTVAVFMAGSGGTYRYGIARFPRTYGDVTIDAATYVYTGSNPTRRPTNSITYTMYGQADIRFTPAN